MASEASNLNEFKRQLDIFISGEKGLKDIEINQGAEDEIYQKKRLDEPKDPFSSQQFLVYEFNTKSCCVKCYFYIVSPCLKKKHFVSEDEFY